MNGVGITNQHEGCRMQGGVISPWSNLHSMYFDDSLAENELHYKIAKYIDDNINDDEIDQLVFDCENDEQYNAILDALFHYTGEQITIYGTSNNPMEIVVEKDPRENYRKFDESFLVDDDIESSGDDK